MEPILDELARRYGLSQHFAERLVPLVERARAAAPPVRQRLLELIEASFQREAKRLAALGRHREAEEDEALGHLAGLLHDWQPPAWFQAWSKGQDGSSAPSSEAPPGS
jgi:hypothetical protein